MIAEAVVAEKISKEEAKVLLKTKCCCMKECAVCGMCAHERLETADGAEKAQKGDRVIVCEKTDYKAAVLRSAAWAAAVFAAYVAEVCVSSRAAMCFLLAEIAVGAALQVTRRRKKEKLEPKLTIKKVLPKRR